MIAGTTAGPLIEIDRCNLPQEAGPCRAARPSWSYDRVTRECQPFLYGGICTLYFFHLQIPTSLISKGCRGNANRFETLGECQTACVNGTSGISTLPAPAPPRRAGGFVFLFNLFCSSSFFRILLLFFFWSGGFMLGGGGGGVPGGHSSVPIDKEVKMVAAKGNNTLLMTMITIMIVTIIRIIIRWRWWPRRAARPCWRPARGSQARNVPRHNSCKSSRLRLR